VKPDRLIPALALAVWAVLAVPALAQRRTDPDDIDDIIKRARQLVRSVADKGFIRYHEQLDPGNIVVLARLKKIAASRRKRIDPEEVVEPGTLGQIGRGIVGRVARATGWVYYRANGKSSLQVEGVLFGPPRSDRLKVHYKLQMEKNSQGKKRYVMLGTRPVELENGLYGVWILKPAAKPKGPHSILRLIPCRVTPDSPKSARKSFKQRQEDYCEVNVAIRLLSDAIRFAQELHELGKDDAAKTMLRDGLKLEPKIKRLEFKEEAASLLKPFRSKAEQMLKALEGKKSGGKQPAPEPPAGQKPGEVKKVEAKKAEASKVGTG
jgi:hypothetical protein